jgi:hypothetical protein
VRFNGGVNLFFHRGACGCRCEAPFLLKNGPKCQDISRNILKMMIRTTDLKLAPPTLRGFTFYLAVPIISIHR